MLIPIDMKLIVFTFIEQRLAEGKVGNLEISGYWNRSFDFAVPTIFCRIRVT